MNKRRKRRRRHRNAKRERILVFMLYVVILVVVIAVSLWISKDRYVENDASQITIEEPEYEIQLLTINDYSRPGTYSNRIKNIVIHYTANPGTTALQNRNYFESLKDTKETRASSHFIVGLDGEIIQCVPTREIAFASNDRNIDSVSIETCHLKKDGKYTKETYDSLVHLTAWLCQKFDLTQDDIIRHYDITGKICPKYFVEDEKAWDKFKSDVGKMLEGN